MKKTLLVRKKIVTIIVTIVMVVLSVSLLSGCALYEVYELLEEEERLEEVQKEKENQERNLSNKIENLYYSYTFLDVDEDLVEEFNYFLEKNFKNPEHILKSLKGLKIYNGNRYQEYFQQKEAIEANKEQFSRKELKKELEQLWNDYEESKNTIQDYLTEEENEILNNCKDEINELYKKYF